MRKSATYIAPVLILLLTTLTVFANKTPPPTPKKPLTTVNTRLSIRVDENATEAKLIIPRQIWQTMKAEIDGEESLNAANRYGVTSTQALMGGVFLSLAFVFGGVWFVRGKGVSKNKVVVGVLVLVLFGAATTISFANMPPPQYNKLDDKILASEVGIFGANGNIKIEVVDSSSSSMTLVLPKGSDKPSGKN